MIDRADTVLPEPDSPTSATISPLAMLNEALCTASTVAGPEAKLTDRSRTSTRGAVISLGSPEGLARIERVAHALTDENKEAEEARDRQERRQTEPRRLEVGLALGQQLAERG